MLVSDLKNSTLPENFLQTLPDSCGSGDFFEEDEKLYCGEPLEITETLTKLYCANPFCPEKGVMRLQAMLKDLGVLNLGEAKCRKLMVNFGVYNPYAIFAYEPSDGALYEGCSMDFSHKIFEQIENVRTMALWEYVKYGNLPGLRDNARKLLGSYVELEDFYEDLEDGQIDFVQEKLGIKKGAKISEKNFGNPEIDLFDDEDLWEVTDDTISVLCVQIYEVLMLFKDELFEFIDSVNIKSGNLPEVTICMSQEVGAPYKSKKDFINALNTEYGDRISINKLDNLTKDCDFLICNDSNAGTRKVVKAKEWGIPILTAQQFIEELEESG